MADATFTQSTRLPLAAWLSELKEAFFRARSRRAEYYRVYAELAQMTDRDLSDIGISRLSIEEIAREAARLK